MIAGRLVRVITRLNVGGPARQALALARDLHEWDTILAAGRPREDEGEMHDPDVTVRRVPLVRPLSPGSDVRAVAALRGVMREHRPDLVHTHMAKAGTAGRLAALTVRPRPRLVHTFHGHVLEGYFGPVARKAFIQVEQSLARRTDVLIAVSAEIRDQLLELGIGRAEQYRVVPLGLDLREHRQVVAPSGALRDALHLASDVPLVGIVGRLVPIKRVDLLLDAIAGLPDVHVAVVGDGELRDALEDRAGNPALRGRVHFTGWRFDIPSVMSDLDVAVLTSANEGTPVSLIEAGACGRPSVATDVGGVRSVVADGVTGVLVPPGDVEALRAAIESLLNDPQRRSAMGRAARDRTSRFTLDRLLTDIRSLYAELVPTRAP